MKRCVSLVVLALLSFALPAAAQDLRIGLKAEPTSLDPQYQNLGRQQPDRLSIFEPLVAEDAQQLPCRRWRCRGRPSATRCGSSSFGPT